MSMGDVQSVEPLNCTPETITTLYTHSNGIKIQFLKRTQGRSTCPCELTLQCWGKPSILKDWHTFSLRRHHSDSNGESYVQNKKT